MTDNILPAIIAPPGEIISDELEARGWTQKDLAEIMGRPEQAINEIINGKKQITYETADQLGQAFGTSAEVWLNLELDYQLWLAQRSQRFKDISRKSRLYSIAPVPELKRIGWIRNTNDVDLLESDICSLLGLASPNENPTVKVDFRQSQHGYPEVTSQIVWVKRVEQIVRGQRVRKFDQNRFADSIPEILKLSGSDEDLPRVPEYLLKLGIRFAIVPHLSRTLTDGAAFWMNGNPVVALTLRYDRIDSFWFSLMHELAHLAAGGNGGFVDTIYDRKTESVGKESKADKLARNWLLDPRAYKSFVESVGPFFSKKEIVQFAQAQERHPGIVVGRLQSDGLVSFTHHRALLVKVKPLLRDWYDRPASH
jgi:HTH-type transcriptional regulator/antitoxin HigA